MRLSKLSLYLIVLMLASTHCTQPLSQQLTTEDLAREVSRLIDSKSRASLGEAYASSSVDAVNAIGPEQAEIIYRVNSRTLDNDEVVSKSFVGNAVFRRSAAGWHLEKIDAKSQEFEFGSGLVISQD